MATHDVRDAGALDDDLTLTADVAIVGTGAGGGVAAEILAGAGLEVVLIEEGAYNRAKDFTLHEAQAYPDLYQESSARKTADKAITILQGRTVGGSTTVNWTTSFRTPPATLDHWREVYGLADYSEEALAPWFARMEERLNIRPWELAPNANNQALARGAEKLGWEHGIISRNVRDCIDLGYCGLGCPVDAKLSMLVTTIPAALDKGATLVTRARAERLEMQGERVVAVVCAAMDPRGVRPTDRRVRVEAGHVVLAGGAIGSPALLMRSDAPDPHKRVGKRTLLHPVCASSAVMPERVEGWSGAPQSVYSDHFLWRDGVTGRVGYKIETPPIYPMLSATAFKGFGAEHARQLAKLPHTHSLIALLRDGFHEMSPGGEVRLRDDLSPVLDYPLDDYLWDGVRRAYLSMAEVQFAAGAEQATPLHLDARPFGSWREARAAIAELDLAPVRPALYSAHTMGGCTMGPDPKTAVVDGGGRHHQLANLSVLDGSLFPTSLGANPQLSIYGIVARNATALAAALGGEVAEKA
jgi:choline dehydrogenase-like flavoprotein